jgi:hypothetical protein
MAATIMEAPLGGASGLTDLLEREPDPLSEDETRAIIADVLALADPPPRRAGARWCRCSRAWLFEPRHCVKCGRDLDPKALPW